MRILFTGSRWLTDTHLVEDALINVIAETREDVVVVHGDCPTGADAIAQDFVDHARLKSVQVERHPADWSRGKRGGPDRNQEMVDLGADVCLAFPLGESRGTRDCIRRARTAGIPVTVFGDAS